MMKEMHNPSPSDVALMVKNMIHAVALGIAGVVGTFTLIAVIYSLAALVTDLPS